MTQAFTIATDASPTTTRVALLVDADNIPQELASRMISAALRLGTLVICRAYGNAALLSAWGDAPGFTLVHAGAGKNAADLLLTVEALALAYAGRADIFVIATSDRDFTHVATHLRERGHHVLGLGEAKAPERLRKAFSAFRELERPESPIPPMLPVVPTPVPIRQAASLEDDVAFAILQAQGSAGLAIHALNVAIRRTRTNFKMKDLLERTWREWLTKRPDLFDCDPKGPDARVRRKAGP